MDRKQRAIALKACRVVDWVCSPAGRAWFDSQCGRHVGLGEIAGLLRSMSEAAWAELAHAAGEKSIGESRPAVLSSIVARVHQFGEAA